MLPHRKPTDNQAFLSVPVSRVGSSARLNQLSSQGTATPNAYASIPSTPNAYVSSSLNPTRNPPILSGGTFKTNEEVEDFEKLPIVQDLTQFEKELNLLSSDISSFRDDRILKSVETLISLNDAIYQGISRVEQHQILGKKIKSLEEERKQLDLASKNTLRKFIQYRAELKKLPSLPTVKKSSDNDRNIVDVKEVLKYAMKLSKFTKAPPSTSDVPFQTVHPNNYIWPAEDALRRGMLAVSSLRGEEIIQSELGGTSVEPKEEENMEVDEEETPIVPEVRHQVHGHQEKRPVEEPKVLDLDLFDPEDEFSD
ncbi:mediator of RNA polymerase II transcription subunit 4 [[Candida] anglica]|uniref:Mediator of RNA polymerase II transcription subunit 4 n=1 Tax=[Candida] anglica TaxID=148631 RepID=A0ABP0ECM4_9ASCO